MVWFLQTSIICDEISTVAWNIPLICFSPSLVFLSTKTEDSQLSQEPSALRFVKIIKISTFLSAVLYADVVLKLILTADETSVS